VTLICSVAIEVEQHATTQLQKKLVEMHTQAQQMEALQDEIEDLTAQNTAYRNRIRAMPSSAFSFENAAVATAPSRGAMYDPAVALLAHGRAASGLHASRSSSRGTGGRIPVTPGFGDTMAKAGALLQLVEKPPRR
jgi:hypothetical protein